MSVKIAVIYYSATGGTHAMAQHAAEVAEKAGHEVRLRRAGELAPDAAIDGNPAWRQHVDTTAATVQQATPDDIDWAEAVLFGSPTRYGNISSQLKQYLDTLGGLWQQGKLANKVYAGFTAAATAHGGQESTILAINNTFYHWGSIIVAPGYADPVQFQAGNPYGASHISNNGANPPGEVELGSVAFQATRSVEIARALKKGLAAA